MSMSKKVAVSLSILATEPGRLCSNSVRQCRPDSSVRNWSRAAPTPAPCRTVWKWTFAARKAAAVLARQPRNPSDFAFYLKLPLSSRCPASCELPGLVSS